MWTCHQVCLSDVVVDRLQATYEEFKLQYGAENVHQIPCDVTDKTQVEGNISILRVVGVSIVKIILCFNINNFANF